MQRFWQKQWKSLLLVVFLVATLPLTVPLARKAWQYVTGASFEPAAIVVSVNQQQGDVLPRPWEGVSQGHEEKNLRLTSAIPAMKTVGVRYVRIDHILDGFDVVNRGEDGKLTYNFAALDLLVSDIIAMGAVPYFSVSYMPPAISMGDITELPKDWGEYGQVVAAYVGHYSRDYKGGLSNVVYEIWNEPDLFGGFKTYGSKNYLTLYQTAANAAVAVSGTKPFLIGGPATTGFYDNWASDMYTKLKGVRIDFFSWHRYSYEVADFVKDVKRATTVIAPLIPSPQKIFISEWGIAADRGNVYDTRLVGAHYLAVARALVDTNIDLALGFEIQDGKGGTQWHGGWGMLTNPEYGPVLPKPRFHAWQFLGQIKGRRLPLAGEGSYVTAMAARDDTGLIRVMAVNYDAKGSHSELFPISFTGLPPGTYTVSEEYLSGRKLTTETIVTDAILKREIVLPASEAVMLTVTAK